MEKEIVTYFQENSEYLLIQCVDEHDLEVLESEYQCIISGAAKPFSLAAIKINDWNSELSPWEAPAVFGNYPFGSGAAETLQYITNSLIPRLKNEYHFDENMKIIIGGYSLAGLFALWCGYQTELFYGVASASPSVWFPNWLSFAENNEFKAKRVYLSLGDKEEHTRNKTMAAVGNNIRMQYDIFHQNNIRCVLEWNEGNHFKDSDIRTAKAFINIMV